MLRDELQSLQLELLNRDNKVKELEMDHKVLVEKWLQMLNDRKDAGPTDASCALSQLIGSGTKHGVFFVCVFCVFFLCLFCHFW